ncbi:hypothetical protein SLEP1_g36419 [Rubroshorea leprosula]|uniref:Uncharacterized protein n=1 Tax=Rubroshorea leprosula TaxID=152421 RepID=A0AAV5KRF5_9ROSI|nr:hypothetical protein SLEP1_g36419 [Rubroshorea leprosula]
MLAHTFSRPKHFLLCQGQNDSNSQMCPSVFKSRNHQNYSFPFQLPTVTSFSFTLFHSCSLIITSTTHCILSFRLLTPKTRQNSRRKVKVRPEQDEDDSGPVQFLESFSGQEKENQWDSDSPPIIARVTNANSISASKVMNNQKNNGEERKLSGRAASVSRPHAVLFGPRNLNFTCFTCFLLII